MHYSFHGPLLYEAYKIGTCLVVSLCLLYISQLIQKTFKPFTIYRDLCDGPSYTYCSGVRNITGGTLFFPQFWTDLHESWQEGGPWDPNFCPPPHEVRQGDFIIEDCVPLSVNEPHDHCATARSRH